MQWAFTVARKSIPLKLTSITFAVPIEGLDGLVEVLRGHESHFAECRGR